MSDKYAGLASMEAKRTAIAEAKTVHELDLMWVAWMKQGFVNKGQLHGALLRRKAELVPLTEDEFKLVEKIDAESARGRALPPIRGTMKGGGH